MNLKLNMKSTADSITTLLDTCNDCAKACYTNAAKCKEMEGMEDCYNACINCAKACGKVIDEFKTNREQRLTAVDQCAHISKECGKECAKHDNDHCRECSEISLKCAEICTAILGQERNPT